MSSTKLDELATCPYCGDEDFHVFHYGEDTLRCHKCKKEFAIKLETVVRVKSSKIYDKICYGCNTYLYDDDLIDGKCPKCSCNAFENNKFKESEFDFKRYEYERKE